MEIEMKAQVNNVSEVVSSLNHKAKFLRSVYKQDLYYKFSFPFCKKNYIRLRSQNGQWLLTRKIKTTHHGLEVNQEQEFPVRLESVENFLKNKGFFLFFKKEKWTQAYLYQDYLLELNHVPPLGTFLEIEFHGQADAHQNLSDLEESFQQLFKFFHVPWENKQELSYYQLMKKYHKNKLFLKK